MSPPAVPEHFTNRAAPPLEICHVSTVCEVVNAVNPIFTPTLTSTSRPSAFGVTASIAAFHPSSRPRRKFGDHRLALLWGGRIIRERLTNPRRDCQLRENNCPSPIGRLPPGLRNGPRGDRATSRGFERCEDGDADQHDGGSSSRCESVGTRHAVIFDSRCATSKPSASWLSFGRSCSRSACVERHSEQRAGGN